MGPDHYPTNPISKYGSYHVSNKSRNWLFIERRLTGLTVWSDGLGMNYFPCDKIPDQSH